MTDRYFALTVTLDRDIREDDCQPIIDAIKMVKCVQSVVPHVADFDQYAAVERASADLRKKLFEVLHPGLA